MQVTRINDRLVIHFLNFVNEKDRERAEKIAAKADFPNCQTVLTLHDIAVAKAKPFGGKAYKGKQYGGGIAFSWSAWEEKQLIEKVKEIQAI